MFKYIFITALVATASSQPTITTLPDDPFTALDQHISHTFAYHYLLPWSKLVRAALEDNENIDEPYIVSTRDMFKVNVNTKRFDPDELKVTVLDRYITVEGTRKGVGEIAMFSPDHYIKQFTLPTGTFPQEVTAVYNENRVLTLLAPRHAPPRPPPEREVPIEVRLPKTTTKKVEKIETTTVKKEEISLPTSTSPLEQLDSVETTTQYIGKIRKKELKVPKTAKDNEVAKGLDSNGLDYALVESDTE